MTVNVIKVETKARRHCIKNAVWLNFHVQDRWRGMHHTNNCPHNALHHPWSPQSKLYKYVCVNYSSQVKSYGWKSSLSCLQLSSSSSLLCLHSFQSARVGMFSTASLARTSLRTHTKPPHRYSVTLTLFSHSAILTSHQVFFPKISWLTFWKQQFVIFRSVHIYVNKTH